MEFLTFTDLERAHIGLVAGCVRSKQNNSKNTNKTLVKSPHMLFPICSMYGIFTNIYPINGPNVGKYTIHGAYGVGCFPVHTIMS